MLKGKFPHVEIHFIFWSLEKAKSLMKLLQVTAQPHENNPSDH